MTLDTARLPAWPEDDFSSYGAIRMQAVGRIQAITGLHLHRNWLSIPHVFHQDEVDVTALEQRRRQWNADHPGVKLTPLVPLIAATVKAIDRYPLFATSLSADGKTLTFKDYRHIGVAVDTPNGLLVPVLRDCGTKSATAIADELAAISEKARTKGLSMAEMAGGVITISSLGHIGGTGFTPIINAPQVAIIGVTKLAERIVLTDDGGLSKRLLLPLSLSYDHRVINGADAARFVRAVGEELDGFAFPD